MATSKQNSISEEGRSQRRPKSQPLRPGTSRSGHLIAATIWPQFTPGSISIRRRQSGADAFNSSDGPSALVSPLRKVITLSPQPSEHASSTRSATTHNHHDSCQYPTSFPNLPILAPSSRQRSRAPPRRPLPRLTSRAIRPPRYLTLILASTQSRLDSTSGPLRSTPSSSSGHADVNDVAANLQNVRQLQHIMLAVRRCISSSRTLQSFLPFLFSLLLTMPKAPPSDTNAEDVTRRSSNRSRKPANNNPVIVSASTSSSVRTSAVQPAGTSKAPSTSKKAPPPPRTGPKANSVTKSRKKDKTTIEEPVESSQERQPTPAAETMIPSEAPPQPRVPDYALVHVNADFPSVQLVPDSNAFVIDPELLNRDSPSSSIIEESQSHGKKRKSDTVDEADGRETPPLTEEKFKSMLQELEALKGTLESTLWLLH